MVDIPLNSEVEDKNNESGINHLLEFMKNSKDLPVTEKMQKLLEVFSKNKLNDTNIKIDNNLKEILLKNLKEEFLKQKENLNQKAPSKVEITKLKEDHLISNINTNKNNKKVETSIILSSESEYEREKKNPFINALDNKYYKKQTNEKKTNLQDIKENLLNKVSYTNSGWGVNKEQAKKKEVPKNKKNNFPQKKNNISKFSKNTKNSMHQAEDSDDGWIN